MTPQPGLLVVDDEEGIREVVIRALKRRFPEHQIFSACDGMEALELLEKQPIHLVLTDLMMPRLNGMDLIKKVRGIYPDIPVVVMTAKRDLDVALKTIETGAISYIQKPFENLAQVTNTVADALGRGSLLSQLNQEMMKLLIEAMPGAMILIDQDRQLKFLNPRAKRILQNEIGNQPQWNAREIMKILRSDPWKGEKKYPILREIELTSGDFELSIHPLHADGSDRLGFLFTLRDLSAQKESERLQREFLSLVSHEFRTPLTVIESGLQLLQRGNIGGDQREVLINRSRHQINRLMKLVNDLLDLSKIESGMLQLEKKPLEIHQFINELVEFFNAGAGEGRVKLHVEWKPGHTKTLFADHHRLQQVMINLIGNALKFSPDQSVVTLAIDGTAQELVIEVIDTGSGIPQDQLGEIFKKFKQLTPSGKSLQGAGLGLPIAKSIVEAHGGSIEVESVEGKGSTFRVKLPTGV